MVTSHQRDRNAGKAGTTDKFEQQFAVDAGNFVHAHQPGQCARNRHGDDNLMLRVDACVLRCAWAGADRTQVVAATRAPQKQVNPEAGQQGQKQAEVQR